MLFSNPKVIPTSTFLRLCFLLGLPNNCNSVLSFRCPASWTACLPSATGGHYGVGHPCFHSGVVSLSRHRNEGNLSHTGVDPAALVSWQSGALSHADMCKCPGAGPHAENSWHSINNTRWVMLLGGIVMLVFQVTHTPTQHNTRCW